MRFHPESSTERGRLPQRLLSFTGCVITQEAWRENSTCHLVHSLPYRDGAEVNPAALTASRPGQLAAIPRMNLPHASLYITAW